MAVTPRERPFAQFNFLVDLGDGVTDKPQAGFQEISGFGIEVTLSDYRPGNHRFNSTIKVATLTKYNPPTLKRGAVGIVDLYKWVDDTRFGRDTARRTVTITLQNEDRSQAVLTWTLKNARLVKYTCGPFNAKGTDVLIEEMVLDPETISME
jgi:phage tail-like protein